jgi:hypothetical protein
MSFDSNLIGLFKFLDWMADKGYTPANTASSRKAAANKVISSLGDQEAENVLSIDIDDAIQRFAVKHGGRYSTDSLQSYKSRVKTALEDFAAYKADPVGFRPSGRISSKPKGSPSKQSKPIVGNQSAKPTIASPAPTAPSVSPVVLGGDVVPVPIREGLIVKIGNLPFDLTADEARKIANVVLAYGGAL